MLVSTSINLYDRTVIVKVGDNIDDLENNKKGIYATSRHMSDEDLILVSKTVMKMAIDKFSGFEGKSESLMKFQLQDSSSIKWTEEQKQMLRTAQEFVSNNRNRIKNLKSKETKKEKRRMKNNDTNRS